MLALLKDDGSDHLCQMLLIGQVKPSLRINLRLGNVEFWLPCLARTVSVLRAAGWLLKPGMCSINYHATGPPPLHPSAQIASLGLNSLHLLPLSSRAPSIMEAS